MPFDQPSSRGVRDGAGRARGACDKQAPETLGWSWLDRALFIPGLVPERPRITFGDSVSEDPTSTAQTLSLLQQAQAVSTNTKVCWLHPDWDDTAVQAEVDRILTETGQAVHDLLQAGAPD